jgi:hypothetical protein
VQLSLAATGASHYSNAEGHGALSAGQTKLQLSAEAMMGVLLQGFNFAQDATGLNPAETGETSQQSPLPSVPIHTHTLPAGKVRLACHTPMP